MLDKPSFDQVALMAREVVHRYMEEELDAVYLVLQRIQIGDGSAGSGGAHSAHD